MIYRKIIIWISFLALLFLAGCSPKSDEKHRTWMDLAKVNENILKAKEKAQVDLPDDIDKGPAFNVGPRVRDLSEQKDTDNPYLQEVVKNKTFEKGESIEGEGVMLNFDNADIYEVIQVMAEVLDFSYMIDPGVKGVVNIRSGKKIPSDELYTIFKKLLNINGIDIRPEGDHYYIQMSAKPSSQIFFDKDQIGELSESSRIVTQVVPVVHISSTEAQKLIEPYLSAQANIYNLADQNTLIIADYESKIIDGLMILNRLDVSSLSALKVKLVKIEQAPLFDVKDELNEILSALKVNKKDYQGIQIMPLERVNSLLLIGYDDSLMSTAEKWILELDRAPTEGRDSIYIYNVRNSVASELTELVNSLITEKKSTNKSKKTTTTKKTTKTVRPPGTAKTTKRTTATRTPSTLTKKTGDSTSMQFAGEPSLVADDARNIILIKALLADYKRILKLLERLDNLPMQVLVEVLVAEVSLTDKWKYGVEWAIKQHEAGITHPYDASFGSASGLNFSMKFDSPDDIFNLLTILATNEEFSILSSPQVLVLNNETATVNVGEQVAIVTSESGTGDATDLNRTVQYKDTGVILSVTPRINYDGIIIIEIDQQVSSVKEVGTGTDAPISPTISTKSVKTKLAVKDGQSILMGGLISKDDSFNESGIPLLKDIPYLGWIFKSQAKNITKKELMIMVTPYVIESENVLDQYIKSFKEKMVDLRTELDN